MSVEGALFTILMVFVMSAFVAIYTEIWLQTFVLRFIAYLSFLSLTFISLKAGEGTLYQGKVFLSSMSDIIIGARDGDEREVFILVIAVMAGFIAALRKIDD